MKVPVSPYPQPPTRRDLLRAGGAALGLLGLAPMAASALPTKPLRLVATTAQVADLLTRVAGDAALVDVLMGEGIDPHSFKLTRSDVTRLAGADGIFFNGLLLEGKITDALEKLALAGKPVQSIGNLLPRDRLRSPPEFEGAFDPHIWMDVSLWAQALPGVASALGRLAPTLADTFKERAEKAAVEFATLHTRIAGTLGTIPPARRVLVTAHDAFGYLGSAYGLEVVGIQGISTESEAGLKRVEELVDLLVRRGIPAVFVETSVSDRNILALIEGAAARGHKVVIGGSLYSDAMGPPGTYEGTYTGMMDHNARTIAAALGGSAQTPR